MILRNHDVHALVLDLDPQTRAFRVLERTALPEDAKMDRGFFVEQEGSVIGVYASPNGPMLFHDADHIALDPDRVRTKLVKRDEARAFQVIVDRAA